MVNPNDGDYGCQNPGNELRFLGTFVVETMNFYSWLLLHGTKLWLVKSDFFDPGNLLRTPVTSCDNANSIIYSTGIPEFREKSEL